MDYVKTHMTNYESMNSGISMPLKMTNDDQLILISNVTQYPMEQQIKGLCQFDLYIQVISIQHTVLQLHHENIYLCFTKIKKNQKKKEIKPKVEAQGQAKIDNILI